MRKLKQVCMISEFYFLTWRYNVKVWTHFTNFIVYILIKRLLDFTELHHTSMQIFEPFYLDI